MCFNSQIGVVSKERIHGFFTWKINGKDTLNSWIGESYIRTPQRLEFTLDTKPNTAFGGALEHRPPSYSVAAPSVATSEAN